MRSGGSSTGLEDASSTSNFGIDKIMAKPKSENNQSDEGPQHHEKFLPINFSKPQFAEDSLK